MKTLLHFSGSGDSYFRAHPLHTLFSLVVSAGAAPGQNGGG